MIDWFVVGLVEGLAIAICLSWIWVNTYHYYPIIATVLSSLVGRNGSETGDTVSLTDDELPTIDALLPAYQESQVIEHSIESINEADYPRDKIALSVLLEPDDVETKRALERIEDEYEFSIITVPSSYPGRPNKPRALNYAFEQTNGDVVSITDAEDVVDPKLYRRIAEKLATGDCDYVQGRLDMVNEDDGWMNTLFRAEYGYWYKVNTPAKYKQGYPIPLGGTTCFFPRDLLETMSDRRFEKYEDPWSDADWEWVTEHELEGQRPWDPKNVTEDFELGLFLWQEGYDAGYVSDTPTREESPLSLDAWVSQRTRWKKGKIYTFIQSVRYPPESLREKIHVYSQSAVPHLGPINLVAIVSLLLAANLYGYQLHFVTSTILIASFMLAVVMLGLYSYGYWTVSDKPLPIRLRRTAVVGLTLPVYWFMQWLADVRALQQTYMGQLHWAKTTHFGRNVEADGAGAYQRAADGLGKNARSFVDPVTRRLALLGIVVLGVALRVHNIGEWSLYGDELYSITARGALPPAELLTVPLTLDSHPPLYYLLLHYWMELFGNSVTSARALSVVFSIGALVLLYRLGLELFDDRVALLAALLFALSTFHVHYGRIARMYSLFALLTLASWYGFVRLRRRTTVSAAGYVVVTALLAYTHVFGLFVLGAQHLYVYLSESRAGINWRRWGATQAAVGVLILPWLLTLLNRVVSLLDSGSEGSIIGWVPVPSIGIITNTVLRYVGWPHNYPILTESWPVRMVAAVLVMTFVCCLVLSFVRYRDEEGYEFTELPKTGQLSLLLTVPIIVPFLVSYLIVPIYFPRFTMPASLALILLVSAGIFNITRRNQRLAVVALVLLSSFALVGQYHATETSADWEGAADCLNDGVERGDAVFYQTFWIQDYLEYYQDTPGAETYGVLSPDEIRQTQEYGHNLSQLRSAASEHQRVWLVQYQPSEENLALSTLLRTNRPTVAQSYGPLTVYQFERAQPNGTEANGTRANGRNATAQRNGTIATMLGQEQSCSG